MASIVVAGDTSGTVTLAAPAVSGTTTLTLPTTSGTVLTSASTILTSQLSGSIASSSLPAGSVLQVLQTVKTDTYSAAPGSSTWADITGMSVSITPSSASNKVMVFLSVHGTTANLSYVRLVRDSTAIGVGETSGSRISSTVGSFSNTGDNNRCYEFGTNFLDSPATTSSTTYKLQVLCETTNTFYLNRSIADQNNTAGFRPISQITVMEIKG
jgi:hypothetical protein